LGREGALAVKKLIIAFAVVLMLSGASVSFMKFMKLGPFASKEAEQASQPVAVKPLATPRFIDMEPLVVSIFDGDKLATNIQITLKLETLSDAHAAQIRGKLPRISDAFLRDLHSFIPRHFKNAERLDVGVLKDRLQMVGDKVMGKDVITGVLIQSVNNLPARS